MKKSDEGKTVSYWEASVDLLKPASLTKTIEADVCIVGGGISGLTAAYMLAKAGRDVIVVDDGLIGGGETSRTTAHLSNALDDRIYRIEEWHGKDRAKLAVESHTAAIDQIQRIIGDENIECDFSRLDGYLVAAENGEDDLHKELKAAHRSGLRDVELLKKCPVGDFGDAHCLRFPDQGQFHILKYIGGLASAIKENGGRLFSNTRAVEWKGEEQPHVETQDGKQIRANSLVLATNYAIGSRMFAKLPAYRTYAMAFKLPRNLIERALIWNTADPYNYVRTQSANGHDVLIVGGEDHRTGQADDAEERFRRLTDWTRRHFPAAGEPDYAWSGQFLETHDGLAFLGRFSESEPNVYIITGDSGMGMTHGTIGGMIVSDLIEGKKNPWTEVYEPSRLATQSIKEAVPEIVSSTLPYTDWVTGGDVSSVEGIKPGEGAIIRDGLSKLAVYRDEEGKLHKRSATCVHLGCIVRFNSLEKTWDCPCHGSRFSVEGEPINTPARYPLHGPGK